MQADTGTGSVGSALPAPAALPPVELPSVVSSRRSVLDASIAAAQWVWSKRSPEEAFWLPPTTIRALLCILFTGSLLYMQWMSPSDGAVPNTLVALGGGAAGFYLSTPNSRHMKALIALTVSGVACAFLLKRTWMPDSLASLAGTVFGMYFAKMVTVKVDKEV